MRKGMLLAGAVLMVLCLAAPVLAQGTLDGIAKRGSFIVGVRDGAIPFGFYNEKNEHVGFSVDMAHEFHKALEKQVGKSLKIEFKTVNPKTRIPLVANGTLDIECGSTTHTISREETVDFTLTVFVTGSRLLVKKASGFKSAKDLAGKKVGAAQGSTNEKAVRDLNEKGVINPKATIVVYQEHPQGMLALEKGIIDAYCGDDIHLAGLRAKAPNPGDYVIVGEMISYDPYAFIVRQNDSKFRNFINAQIIEMVRDGRYNKIYEKWFGPKGAIPFPMSEEFSTLMQMQVLPK